MPWARFDDRFPSNRKIRPLSDGAFRLYVSAICWSAENLTDGVVKATELRLVADVRAARKRAQELVNCGLWVELSDGGWRIHDYHEYNPTAEQVRAERAAKTARQKRWRDKRRGDDPEPDPPRVDASTDASHDASRDGTGDAAPRARVPGPARPDPTHTQVVPVCGPVTEVARETKQGAHTPIPHDFTPTDDALAWAHREGHAARLGGTDGLRATTAAFVDWHTARGTRAADPNALWRKWVREQHQAPGQPRQGAFLVPLPGGGAATPAPPTFRERMAELDAIAAADRKGETG